VGDEEAEPMRERERESSEGERRVRWKYVGVEILTWRCFEEGKKFLSISGFNLYTIDFNFNLL
jgi:hypothetical protein